jgi:hypothetical protein
MIVTDAVTATLMDTVMTTMTQTAVRMMTRATLAAVSGIMMKAMIGAVKTAMMRAMMTAMMEATIMVTMTSTLIVTFAAVCPAVPFRFPRGGNGLTLAAGREQLMVMNDMSRLTVLSAALCLVAGCVGAGRVAPASSLARLEPEATVELGSPAVGVCRDGDGLLVLESSGTRIIRLAIDDWRLASAPQETLPLTDRMTAPTGIAADRFYIYVHDDHALYRMSKEKLTLQPWLGNVRVVGLASFESGMMLVSDGDRGSIWYKGLFGESRQFISGAEVARPGAMVALPDGTYAVVSADSKLVYFNRSGVVLRTVPIPNGCDLLAGDETGELCIGQRGKPLVWTWSGNRLTGFRLPDSVSPLSLAVAGGRLAVLDAGTRIRVFRMSEAE